MDGSPSESNVVGGTGVPGVEHRDTLLALKNAAKLGGSLAMTWGIAIVVRLLMPRYLGPDAWGPLSFSDAFTATFFVALSLGVDTYIRREVSVRPAHASDFLAGITLIRVIATVVLLGVMQVVMLVTHRPPEVQWLVYVFGLACFASAMNLTFAALLHARGTVDELSFLNIASKVVWAGGTLAALLLHWPLVAIPAALLASETLKLVVSVRLVHVHLNVRWRLNGAALKLALVASLPMFLNTAAHTIYNKIDVSILAVVAGDREVAWYGASSLLAGMTLMIAPMIGWVLMPLFARARARSELEYTRILRRSLELVLIVAIPCALFMALGASLWVKLLYGPEYAPAAASLRLLSPLFVLTYVAMLNAHSLILTGRAWTQAFVSVGGVLVNPLLNWLFIPLAVSWYSDGGAGRGAASAQLVTELVVTAAMMVLVGARAFDRRTLIMLLKTSAVCLLVWVLDAWLVERAPAMLRLAADGVAYVALLLFSGAVQVRETLAFAFSAAKKSEAAPAKPDSERSP
jgi:O-antigen/teichoic acid export membrane protein